jgi:transcription termination/antitermination factor NusG
MSELQESRWYVVHTYSGHENKVKATIEKAVKTRGMEQFIQEVVVPTEDVVETTKTGKEKVRQRKIYPSYVLIKMIITDESWYIVRNTKGVTGFVGPGSKPVPLSEAEVEAMGIDLTVFKVSGPEDLEEGEVVTVTGGPFVGHTGVVKHIDTHNDTARICIDAFGGKETPLEVSLKNIERI